MNPNSLPPDPISIIQIFAQHLRAGTLAPGRGPVKSRSVEDTVRGMGQTYAGLGAADPCLNPHGQVDFRLTSLYRAWANADPYHPRFWRGWFAWLSRESTPAALAAVDVLILGFFFLLRPGEYLGVPNDATDTLFRFKDVAFWVGSRALQHWNYPAVDLQAATFATLTFTRQKNGVRNETIGHHGRSGHPHLCPVLRLVARVLALRASAVTSSASTPINAFCDTPGGPIRYVHARDLTRRMRSALTVYPDPSIPPRDISARFTRPGGAVALLCAGVGADRIRLLGRWRSDELYRYLHVQAQQVMTGLSAAMLHGGTFQLAP